MDMHTAACAAAAASFIVGGAHWYDVIAGHMTAKMTFDLEKFKSRY